MKQQHNAVAAGPVETTPGPALEIRTMGQQYVLKSQSGRVVHSFADENRARARMSEMAARGTRLRLFRVVVQEQEMAA